MPPLARAFIFPLLWPLRTTAPVDRIPATTYALLGFNLLCFLAASLYPGPMLRLFALWPNSARAWQYITYGFLHEGSWLGLAHLCINLLFLWIFAPAVECRIGWWRFGTLYVLAAAVGGFATEFSHAQSGAPLAGASGAVLGILGAYLILFPFSYVKSFFCLLILIVPFHTSVIHVLALFFALIYWGFDVLIVLLAPRIGVSLGRTDTSLIVHMAGMITGAGLAAAIYGLQGFSKATKEEHLAERRLQLKLAHALDNIETDIFGPVDREDPEAAPPVLTFTNLETPPDATPESTNQFLLHNTLLFGDPDDTDANVIPAAPRKAQPQVAKVSQALATPPILDSDDAVSLDETGGGASHPSEPHAEVLDQKINTSRLRPSLESRPIRTEDAAPPEVQRRLGQDEGASGQASMTSPAPPTVSEPPPAFTLDPVEERLVEIVPPVKTMPPEVVLSLKPIRLEEESGGAQAVSMGPIAFEDEPIHFELETSADTQTRAEQLRDKTPWPDLHNAKYSIILTPGQPLDVDVVSSILGALLGLGDAAARHALLRRRGILAENLKSTEAGELAARYARQGQSVTLVAQTSLVDFPESQDLLSYQDLGDQVRLATFHDTFSCAWDQVVCLGAGLVALAPASPDRAVLDMFLAHPRRHLRMWESIHIFPKQAEPAASVRFRQLAWQISSKARRAIHTRTLDTWLADAQASHPHHHFSSLIEYQNYLHWHLLAHLAPGRLYKSDKYR